MKKILIVDDDVRLLTTMRRVLEATGKYAVTTEDSGQRALAAAAASRPDLIVLDMNMPEMGGVEFLKHIALAGGTLKYPVLVVTARANMAGFFADMAVDGFIAKPCDPNDLLAAVDRIVQARPEAAAGTKTDQTSEGTPRRILLGEDDPAISIELMEAFRRAGYEVNSVSQGPHMLQEAVVQRPDVILVKLVLTNLNGDAVARMLKEMPNTKNIPVILYSRDQSYADPSRFASPQSGVTTYVKSDEPPVLLRAIAEVLAAPPTKH